MAVTNRITRNAATPALQLVRGGTENANPSHGRTSAAPNDHSGMAGKLCGVATVGEARRTGTGVSVRTDGGRGAQTCGGCANASAGASTQVCASRVIDGVGRSVTARAHAASRELREKFAMALEHAELLTVPECEILLAIAEQGFTVRALARVSGRSERDIRRTLRSVAARADAPLFRFVVKTRKGMPPRLRAVAEAIVFRGASLREAGKELGLTVWAVRQHRDRLVTRFVTREQT